jgi:hypothetical protein
MIKQMVLVLTSMGEALDIPKPKNKDIGLF